VALGDLNEAVLVFIVLLVRTDGPLTPRGNARHFRWRSPSHRTNRAALVKIVLNIGLVSLPVCVF